MAEKKKDPFAKENIGKTLDERVQHFQNLVGALQGMDGELKAKIAKHLKKASGGPNPDYSLIDETSKNYNAKVAQEVVDMIEGHYDTTNELSPLNKAFDASKTDPLTKEAVTNLYHGHKESLKREVGSKNYHLVLENLQKDNLSKVIAKLDESAPAGYDMKKHGDAFFDWLKEKYQIDVKNVDAEMLKRYGHDLIGKHVTGALSKDYLHSVGRKYRKAA